MPQEYVCVRIMAESESLDEQKCPLLYPMVLII